ncbi:prepilin-type N-terminal cleavage/methylation domain-containing protein [Pseudomonas baltica]|uniref:PilW family protein n=1 Tax=Pseudomonas baltica TaxID=2762576 RepID=UPI002896C012|nr:prepilin-type N-terminal cleavage/methylation domain-containing protein [Pseudomonas baltica]
MKTPAKGYGLVELMVAMAIGLIIVLGVTQIFISAKNTFMSQNAASTMQEDARYVLSRMVQELRMVGMQGCIAQGTTSFTDASNGLSFTAATINPIIYTSVTSGGATSNVLTLVTGDVGANGGVPTWTIVSDCLTTAKAYTGTAAANASAGELAFPIRKVIYTFANSQLSTTVNGTTSVLINGVKTFNVSFGMATAASPYAVQSYTAAPALADYGNIRSVRISMILTDPNSRVRDQPFNVVASLRNRLR